MEAALGNKFDMFIVHDYHDLGALRALCRSRGLHLPACIVASLDLPRHDVNHGLPPPHIRTMLHILTCTQETASIAILNALIDQVNCRRHANCCKKTSRSRLHYRPQCFSMCCLVKHRNHYSGLSATCRSRHVAAVLSHACAGNNAASLCDNPSSCRLIVIHECVQCTIERQALVLSAGEARSVANARNVSVAWLEDGSRSIWRGPCYVRSFIIKIGSPKRVDRSHGMPHKKLAC